MFADGFEAESAGFTIWRDQVQPAIAAQCSSCHLGERFGITTLARQGVTFTAAETRSNYEAFLRQISLDAPPSSRLLAKLLPTCHAASLPHAGGNGLVAPGDALHALLITWIE